MEDKQLRYFLAVCKCGNITQAAEELYITQQTLSKQIKNFEAELGAPLFTRSVRGAEPTEYAKKLLEPATQIVWVADNALRTLDEMRRRSGSPSALALCTEISTSTVPWPLSSFLNGSVLLHR